MSWQIPLLARHRTVVVLIALAVLIPFAVLGAYYEAFGAFEAWDDEGYAMITIDGCARGHALYDQVFSQYGPFYYFLAWLGFDVGPLDHATVRWLVLCAWLGSALACCALVWKLGRNAPLTAIAFVASFAHLFRLATEPGHPQALVVLCVSAIALLPALLAERRARLCCAGLGALAAAITLTKINIGVYATLALVLAIVEHLPATASVRWIRRASWTAAIALPCAVMVVRLDETWAMHYAAAVTGTVILVALTLRKATSAPSESFRPRDAFAFAAAFLGLVAVVLIFTSLRGTTPHGLLDGILLRPLAMARAYVQPLEIAVVGLSPLVASGCLWFVVHRLLRGTERARDRGVGVLAVAKLGFGLWVLHTVWRGDTLELLQVQAPFLWLCLIPPPDQRTGPARVFLVLVAALQLLHAFPVAGSQVNWGTLLLIPAAAIGLGDAYQYLSLRARRAISDSGFPAEGAIGLVILIVAFGWIREYERGRREHYFAQHPLDLPGTGPLRISEGHVATYTCLARNIATADAFYSLPGLNSFYFWARRDPPTTLNATAWQLLFSPQEQLAVRTTLEPHRKLLVLVDWHHLDPMWQHDPDPVAEPLTCFITGSTRLVGVVGLIDVRARDGWMPELIDCARVAGDTVHLRIASREGRKIARIVVADYQTDTVIADSVGAVWRLVDEAGAARDLGPGTWDLDLSFDRHLELHGTALPAALRRTRTPVVRLFDSHSEVVARLPFLR